jgi:PKD repeat protein
VLFENGNPRPATPEDVGGRFQVSAANVLNYFNTIDQTGAECYGPPNPDVDPNDFYTRANCRGADSQVEFERQATKIVEALNGTGADVIGLMEIENDGYGPDSALADLVGRLNADAGAGTWAFINADSTDQAAPEMGDTKRAGTDAIRVAIIYKPDVVTPVGTTAVLNTTEFVNGGDPAPRNRPSIAQAFEEDATGEVFVFDINHLKSKGSPCAQADQGDGQGNCNQVRTTSANLLTDWLASDPTGTGDPDIMLAGDLNSYAKEDPIQAIEEDGYVNLIAQHLGPNAYSYQFDGQWGYLDHALATDELASQVTGATEWHINADEPVVLDYNVEFKSTNPDGGQVASLYAPDQYRSSDHDYVIVGLGLTIPNQDPVASFTATPDRGYADRFDPLVVEFDASASTDADGTLDNYHWDFGDGTTADTDGPTTSHTYDTGCNCTVTLTVTDDAGGTDDATQAVDVIRFFWRMPTRGTPNFNDATAGTVHPVRFTLGGDHGLDIFEDGYPHSTQISCTTGKVPANAVWQLTSATNPPLLYNAAKDRLYTYRWITRNAWAGTCRMFQLQLNDHDLTYQLRIRFAPATKP